MKALSRPVRAGSANLRVAEQTGAYSIATPATRGVK